MKKPIAAILAAVLLLWMKGPVFAVPGEIKVADKPKDASSVAGTVAQPIAEEKIPVEFALDDLISYGLRHNPEMLRLALSRSRQVLVRDFNLYFTDPSLQLSASAFHRESAGAASSATQSGVRKNEGMNVNLSLTKPFKSGDTFTISNNFYTTQINVPGADIPTAWGGSLQASYTWQILKDRGTGVTLLGYKQEENNLLLADAQVADQARSLSGGISTAYYNAAYLMEALRAQEESLDYYVKLLDRNNERYKVGLGLKSDVLQAENAKLSQESEVAKTRAQLDDALRNLTELIGYSEGAPVKIAPLDTENFARSALVDEDLWDRVIDTSFALRQIDIQSANLGLTKSFYENQLLPDIDLTASLSTQGEDTSLGKAVGSISDAQSYSLSLTYKLPWGKRELKSRLAQNGLQAGELAESRRKAVAGLRTTYESLKRQLETTLEQIGLQESNVKVAEESADILRERQRVGLATTLDVLDAERKLLLARLGYISAVSDHLRADYSLKVLAGMVP